MKTETLSPETIKDFNGRAVNIANYRKSLTDYPSYCRKDLAPDGTPFLHNLVERDNKCGCRIEGNGTLQFPMRINFCEKHTKGFNNYDSLLSALKDFCDLRTAYSDDDFNKAYHNAKAIILKAEQ